MAFTVASNKARTAITAAAIACCALVIAALSRPPAIASATDEPLIPRKQFLRVLGKPVLNLVTDYYWVQTLQAVTSADDARSSKLIYYYADLVSDLDPAFRAVYVFAGASIPFPEPSGQFTNTEEAIRILEKGYRNVPDNILLRILLAYDLVTYRRDYREAARIVDETSRMPRAPDYLKSFATRLYAQAGDFDSGLALTEAMIDQSTDPEARAAFERQHKRILLERELHRVDAAAAAFARREGHAAPGVAALRAAGDLATEPVDPFGGRILLDAGRARATEENERLRLFSPDETGP